MPCAPLATAALAFILRFEGGFVDDPADPGGVTNFGVSLRWLRAEGLADRDGDGRKDGDIDGDGDIDADDIRLLTAEEAGRLFLSRFWNRYGCGTLPPVIATIKTFDLAVNAGPTQAHRLLQRAVRSAWAPLVDDGVLGPKTRSSVLACDPERLLPALCSEAAGFYRLLAATRPPLERFLSGWLNRAYARPVYR